MRRPNRHSADTGCVWIFIAAAGLAVSACGKKVVVETSFPEPVISELPLDAGVYYPESLANYDYIEDLPNDIEWSITLGEANIKMFDAAFGALFGELESVEQPGGTGTPFDRLDVVIEPTVDAFEFSLPRQARSDQYAVWIRYNLKLYEPNGQFITNWLVSAYGQADSRLFRGGGAMETAVVRAMRDAIANIVIGFPKEPAIKAALLPEAPEPEHVPAEELAAEPLPVDNNQAEEAPEEDAPAEESATEEGPTEEVRS